MKISRLHRIYSNIKLIENYSLNLAEDHSHYLKTVLRLKIGDHFRIFNGIDGEFIAQITDITKNNLHVELTNILRKTIIEPELTLGISIIKSDRMLDAIDMAVQLGVTKIIPLITERSQFRNVNNQKLMKCIIESTEQSERLIPPILMPLTSLSLFLDQNLNNSIIYANENEDENNTLLKIMPTSYSNISVIVGPEGGFSPNELKILSLRPNSLSISLGVNVLRTETAVAACLAQIKLFTQFPSQI
ncbi:MULTISPECIES: 16S rRNA (uracil(1498)-N(3))-methyltransferase [Rickettsieae]|uniref:16S rRNA (uracil(1498)-N(3))-methyltransferase n=1 Tax=Rickettsieae TaxID=33988 RepID=UPI000B9C3476|nr:16S rRNA (uracil(1498)-N(3))-methyltransferase [Rickettsia endosymbiont of Culicoides newsteadi]OZG32002.1 16S rRNA (uracil(1498)-N(3))-methyltransferase [Rickettsia endosymbiont of Culicoides newsteadi]